jgi:hypothetical protein
MELWYLLNLLSTPSGAHEPGPWIKSNSQKAHLAKDHLYCGLIMVQEVRMNHLSSLEGGHQHSVQHVL